MSKKIDRYYWYYSELRQCEEGDDERYTWCDGDDVARLEASYAELLEAAKHVVDRWNSSLWKEQEHTGTSINRLCDAIAKAEGEEKHP